MPPLLPRNRRFLVSIWRTSTAAPPSTDAETIHGLVWEADPREPGRIATPQTFASLSALPHILQDLLHHSGQDTWAMPDDGKGGA